MGTTMNFILLSEKPEYNEKIKIFIALAPVAFMTHIKSPIRFLAPFSKDIEVIYATYDNENFPNLRKINLQKFRKFSFLLIF